MEELALAVHALGGRLDRSVCLKRLLALTLVVLTCITRLDLIRGRRLFRDPSALGLGLDSRHTRRCHDALFTLTRTHGALREKLIERLILQRGICAWRLVVHRGREQLTCRGSLRDQAQHKVRDAIDHAKGDVLQTTTIARAIGEHLSELAQLKEGQGLHHIEAGLIATHDIALHRGGHALKRDTRRTERSKRTRLIFARQRARSAAVHCPVLQHLCGALPHRIKAKTKLALVLALIARPNHFALSLEGRFGLGKLKAASQTLPHIGQHR